MIDLTLYGGVNEIGGNKVLLQSQHGSVFLDFGLSYKQEAEFFEEFLQPRTNSKFYDLYKLGLLPTISGIYRKDVFCPEGLNGACTPTPEFWQTELTCFEEACLKNTWHPGGYAEGISLISKMWGHIFPVTKSLSPLASYAIPFSTLFGS